VRWVLVLALGHFVANPRIICAAQDTAPSAIRVETREVVLPVHVIKERKDPKGLLLGPNGQGFHAWIYHTEEVVGLSSKSFRVFEDGVEQQVQHFSIEEINVWNVTDNVGEHVEHAWTPSGIWSTGDERHILQSERSKKPETYLVSYVPGRSPAGSCHRITLRVANKHSKLFAPDQYCNTKNPLSDPIDGKDVGAGLLEYANSQQLSSIPLALQLTSFSGRSGASRINVSVEMPANLLKREWKANHLLLSVAVLGLVYDSDHALVARFSDTVCPPPECDIWYEGAIPQNSVFIPQLRDAQRKWEDLAVPTSYRTQLEVAPGDYKVEVVLTDGEKFGRAEDSVRVNDYLKDSLGISGIALCKRYHRPSIDERGPTRAPQNVPLMFDGQEFTPAGDLHFKRGEPLMAYLDIYNNSPSETATPAPKLYLEMKVWDTRTGELKIGTGLRPVESGTPSRNSRIPIVSTLAIEKLPAGTYRIQAEASDSAGHKTEWRETSFIVD